MNNTKLTMFSSVLLMYVLSLSAVQATDIVSPANIKGDLSAALYLDRTDQGTDPEWEIWGDNRHLSIRDDVNDTDYNSKLVFELKHSFNNENSFIVDTSGDINLADGSVFIDKSENRIGLGTTIPEGNLHMVTPGLTNMILESGWGGKWNINVGAVGLYFTDALNHNSIVKIFNYGKVNSLVIRNGNIGLGTNTPQAKLDVRGDAVINGELNTTKAITASFSGDTSKAALKMMDISVNNTDNSQKSDVGFAMTNARENFTWSFRTWEPDSGFAIAKYGNGGTKEFRLYDSDPTDATTVVLQLANGAWCDGVWHNTSSRSMKQDIQPLSTKEALEAFKKLQPVTYAYKANPTDPKVGFIAEDVPELVADPKHKSLSAMDMVALLTKVVQVQEKTLGETKTELKAKDAEIKKMKADMQAKQQQQDEKIARLETLLTNLALDTSSSKKENISFNLK